METTEQEVVTELELISEEDSNSEQDLTPDQEVIPEENPIPEPDPTTEQDPKPEEETVETNTQAAPIANTKNTYDDYFTNSVFVGDSVMEGFAQYVRGQRKEGVSMLSNAQFLTSIMGIRVADITGNTAGDSRHYVYKGNEQSLETILKQMGVDRVFIMLGMNDLSVGFTTDETIERYGKMISILKETNPNLDIVVMTTTPKTATKWLPDYVPNKNFGSPLLNEFAGMLKTMCEENGINVVDINAAVRGADGHLPEDYSRDNYVHINNKCSAIVLDTMRKFAKTKLEG